MQELTSKIKGLESKDVNWQFGLFYKVMSLFESHSFLSSYWEDEENWASILSGSEVNGYLWKRYPLLMIKDCLCDELKKTMENIGVEVITVKSLSNDELILDEEIQKVFFPDLILNSSACSAEDLWLYTNT